MTIESFALLLAGALLFGACGGPATARSAATVRAEVGEVPAELQGDYQSFSINCSKCHDLERALAAPVTDVRHWDIYVAKMMRTAGSAINPSEAPHILRFLYWYTEQKNNGGARTKASRYAPPAAPSSAPPPGPSTKEETHAPAPNLSSETQGESTP